ncbi:MAG: penicillin binding protein PBP4B [Burkholderiales bacterium]|nr:penicillin binding protein PBP4B [Burkholderiales bacterium]
MYGSRGLKILIMGLMPTVSFAQTECNYFTNVHESGLTTGTPAANGFDSAKLALVDKQINQDIQNGFPGVGLLIIKDGKVVKQTVYGYSLKFDPQSLQPLAKPRLLSCSSLFDLASNTKMYATNFAIMQLVSEGKLNLDKPIHTYIPEYTGCDLNDQCRDTRTVRDLLTHSAGYMPDPQFFNPSSVAHYGAGLYSQNRNMTESILYAKLPFADVRGGKPNYSDVDFMLLGLIVEKISGLSLDSYVEKNLYQPLNLKSTWFNPLNHGYEAADCAATEVMGNTRGGTVNFPNIRTKPLQCQVHDEKAFYSMAGISGHAGLFSNLGDMAVLTQLALNNGSYAGKTYWKSAVESQFIAPLSSDDSYGLGWRRAGAKHSYTPFGHYASNLAYGHTGWTGTVTLIDPKYNLIIVLLTNKKHSTYRNGQFAGDGFATGKYAPIIDLIYQALPETQSFSTTK